MSWPDIIVALVSAITGGGLLKLGDFWVNKGKVKFDEDKVRRDEYRTDIDSLRQQMKDLKTELKEERQAREKAEDEHDRLRYDFGRFKLEMYKVLNDHKIDTLPYNWEV